MAEEPQFDSRPDNKRKYEDQATAPAVSARRATGFSALIASPSPDSTVASVAAPPSYNSVPPPADGIQLAKQRAQEIAARLFNDAEAKRPRTENGGAGDDSNDKGFGPAATDYLHKPLGQQITNSQLGGATIPSFQSYGYQGSSKKIDIPNGRVGVIIGKGGETIKYLQLQSGAKIQVTRDMDVDPGSQTRLVELMGTSEQISKAEQLINDVLAEAEAGASSMGATRRFSGGQDGAEQFIMKVPNNKVGLIIGKGGETIKNMQARSGARIQLIPLHLPPGDTSTERTVHIDGTKEQIESAKQLVNEVTSENRVRNPSMAGGYTQQGYRPPRPTTSWGPPGPPPMQQPGYGYMQPGAYPGPPPPYNMSQPPYAGYPPPSSGWDQTSNPASQQTAPGTGYDYYNQQQQPQQAPAAGSSTPADAANYNYGQPQPSSYNPQGSYGESTYSQPPAGQQQGYGQDGYSGGYQTSAPQAGYPPSTTQSGYDQQPSYSSTPAYGAMATTTQDGANPGYGAQGAPAQVPPAQQVPSVQPPATQQGYNGQVAGTTAVTYPSQGTSPGYAMAPTSLPGYGNQPSAQAGYGQSPPLTQPNYGALPQGQKPPSTQTVYGQGQQPQTTQSGYVQPAPVQSGYAPPSSGYASGVPQPAYGQQPPYGSAPPQGQPVYSQQQQQAYSDSYGGSGYSQPPYDNAVGGSMHGAYDAASAGQTLPSGVTKASPQG